MGLLGDAHLKALLVDPHPTTIEDHFLCSICQELLDKPTTVCNNGHTYCANCIAITHRRWTCSGRFVACPYCHHFLQAKEMGQQMSPQNNDNFATCNNYSGHLAICQEAPVCCDYLEMGCTARRMPRKELPQHLIEHATQHTLLMAHCMRALRQKSAALEEKQAATQLQLQILQQEQQRQLHHMEWVIPTSKFPDIASDDGIDSSHFTVAGRQVFFRLDADEVNHRQLRLKICYALPDQGFARGMPAVEQVTVKSRLRLGNRLHATSPFLQYCAAKKHCSILAEGPFH